MCVCMGYYASEMVFFKSFRSGRKGFSGENEFSEKEFREMPLFSA